jgi:hypothetical protein
VHRRTYRGSPKLPIKGRYAKSWAAEVSIEGRYWASAAGRSAVKRGVKVALEEVLETSSTVHVNLSATEPPTPPGPSRLP